MVSWPWQANLFEVRARATNGHADSAEEVNLQNTANTFPVTMSVFSIGERWSERAAIWSSATTPTDAVTFSLFWTAVDR